MKRLSTGNALALMLILSFVGETRAQALSPGDIAIVGVNSRDPDEFTFFTLVDLPEGTEIRFSDLGWPHNPQVPDEGELVYTATAPVEKGTVIRIYPGIGGPEFGSRDQLLAYQGTRDTPSFIYALNFNGNGVWQSDALDPGSSALPPGLQDGTTAVAVYGCANVAYARSLEGTRSELLAAIGNRANWTCDNSRALDFGLLFGWRSYGLPTFREILPDTTLGVEEFFSFTFSAPDPDTGTEQISYAITPDPPSGAIFSTTTGFFRWQPAAGQEGAYPFQISASDGVHSARQSFLVTVVTVAPRPYFTLVPEGRIRTGYGGIELRYAAEDPNGEDVELSAWLPIGWGQGGRMG